jgi:hypothetical protein
MTNRDLPTTSTGEDDEAVVLTRGQLDALLARIDRLEPERAGPAPRPAQAGRGPTTPKAGPGGTVTGPSGPARVGRRRALAGLAGAAAAGTAAALGSSAPAAADDGDPLLLGEINEASTTTEIHFSDDEQGFMEPGLSVIDGDDGGDASGPPAIYAYAQGDAFSVGLRAVAGGTAQVALMATAVDGTAAELYSASTVGNALLALSDNIGIAADGPNGQIQLSPNIVSPLELTGTTLNGTLYSQATPNPTGGGTLWACVHHGTPGTWRKIVGHDTAGAFHILPTPIRVYDSRAGTVPAQGPKTPLAPGTARTIDLKHNGSGVPAGATGVLLTVLLVNAANANANMTVWANDKAKPQSNTMVWGGATGRFTGTAVTAVDAQARVKVDASHATNIVLDVVGYYR